MTEPQSCAGLAIEVVSKGYSFLTSEVGRALFASLAGTRALIVFCGRSSFVEARKLANSLAGGLLLTAMIAAVEFKVPASIKLALSCKNTGQALALARSGTGNARPTLEPGAGKSDKIAQVF